MINIPPIKPSAEIKMERLPDVSKTWKIGQVLNATVESGGKELHKILLRIGQQQVEARAPLALKSGDSIKLVVKSLGDTPLLSILANVDRSTIAAEKLRSVIARQQDITDLIRQAQKLVNRDNLSPPLKNLLQQLLKQIPSSEQLSQARQLRTSIQNSGVLLEPRILKQPEAVQADIKSTLLKISDDLQKNDLPQLRGSDGKIVDIDTAIRRLIKGDITLRQLVSTLTASLNKTELTAIQNYMSSKDAMLPPSLALSLPQIFQHLQQQPNARQLMDNLFSLLKNLPAVQELKTALDGALAKLTSQQLMPLTREAETPLLLLFDLPVKDKNQLQLFQFRIEEETGGSEKKHSSWTITINFNVEPLGAVQAKLHLIDDQISTVFRAEKTATVAIIQQHIDLLEQAFSRAGLQVTKLDVIAGQATPPRQLPDSIHILDEQA